MGKNTIQRWRARRRGRGAAMVEAVVTIPFFTLIFIALIFVGKLYVTKQKTLSLARQQAWTYAMQNCEGSLPDVNSKDAGSIPQQGDMDLSSTQQFEGAPGGDTASKGSREAVSTIKGKVTSSANQNDPNQKLGPLVAEKNLQTTAWVTCNEKPQKGDLKGVLSTAWGIFTGW